MGSPRILLVYYSRTGSTRKVGEELARELQCDVEELTDTQRRLGIVGYLRSGLDAVLGRTTLLGRTTKDPHDYDLVVIGTPVWAATVSTPIRTYLGLYKASLKNVAFFATCSPGMNAERALEVMEKICGERPLSTRAFDERRVMRDEHLPELTGFAREIRLALATRLPEQEPVHRVGPPPGEQPEELRH